MRKLKKAVIVMSVGSLCIAPVGIDNLHAQDQMFGQTNLLSQIKMNQLIGNQIDKTSEGSVREIPNVSASYELTYGDSLKIQTSDAYFYDGEEIDGITVTNEKEDDIYTTIFTADRAGVEANIVSGDVTISINTVKRKLTTNASIKDKTYDGTVNAQYDQIPVVSNVLSKDEDSFTYTYSEPTFDTKDCGSKKKISVIELVSNNDNYTIEKINGLTASITKKELTVSDVAVKEKTYDKSTEAQYVATPKLIGVVGNEDVKLVIPEIRFQSADPGEDKDILYDDFAITGEDISNYDLKQPEELRGTIHKAKLVFKAKDQYRKYGEASEKGSYSVTGFVTGDDMTTITEPTVENTVPRLTSLGKHEGAVKVMDAVAPDYYDITYIPGDLYVEANDIKKDEHYTTTTPDGKNDWFVSDNFEISPIQGETSGYDLISTSANGPWLQKISYSKDIKNGSVKFYLKDSKNNVVSKVDQESYKIDKTKPEVENIAFDLLSGYENYKTTGKFRNFFDHAFKTTITTDDKTSGVESVSSYLNNEGQKSENSTVKAKKQTFNIQPDFKGHVYATAEDAAGNKSDEYQSAGVILESNGKHSVTSSIKILEETEQKEYYNHDVYIGLEAMDSYSGIQTIKYDAGSNNSKKISYDDMKHNYQKDHVKIAAAENNQNDVKANFTMIDNTGHKSTVHKTFNIDISAPEISVSYDNNESKGKYFKHQRTATITINERNFSNKNTNVYVTKNGKKEQIKSNFITDGILHERADGSKYYTYKMNVVFSKDGEYSLDVNSTDLAGNKNKGITWNGTHVQDFVIDQTTPQIKVTFDNNSVKNGKYYKADRTATIRVTEKNFKPFTVDTNGRKSSWKQNGDEHVMTVTFDKDGTYHLSVEGEDLAGNAIKKVMEKEFIIDKTVPKIGKITPGYQTANAGRLVPSFVASDKYIDSVTSKITGAMKNQTFKSSSKKEKNAITVTYEQIPNKIQNDDYYTYKMSVSDKAGNKTDKTIHYSVNRYGSVYVLGNYEKKLNGSYVNDAKDIKITEINPSKLKTHELQLVRDNEKVNLDRTNSSIKIEGNGWNKCTYSIKANAFEDEGVYKVITTSKDEAAHNSRNDMKRKHGSLSFGVDRTNPNVIFSNIQNGKVYAEDGKSVTILIKDNLLLESAKITVNGKVFKEYNGTVPESIEVPLLSKNTAQSIEVLAVDAAGNTQVQTVDNIYITKNPWIRFTHYKYMRPIIAAICGVGIAIVAIVVKKRKSKNELNNDDKNTNEATKKE